MTPEKKFENEIIAELKKRGWFAHHFDANGVDGWPDILALNCGMYMLIEVKAGTEVSVTQKAFIRRMEDKHNLDIHVILKHSDTKIEVRGPGVGLPFHTNLVSALNHIEPLA